MLPIEQREQLSLRRKHRQVLSLYDNALTAHEWLEERLCEEVQEALQYTLTKIRGAGKC